MQAEFQWFVIGLGTGLFVLLLVLRLLWNMPVKYPREIARNVIIDALICKEAEKMKLDCSPDFTPLKRWKYILNQLIARIYWFFKCLKYETPSTVQRFLDSYEFKRIENVNDENN